MENNTNATIKALIERVKVLEEENLALHSIIDSYLAKQNEERTVAYDSVTEYEEWLNSEDGDKLAQAYADSYGTQEVAVDVDLSKYTDDAKERMSQSHLWL